MLSWLSQALDISYVFYRMFAIKWLISHLFADKGATNNAHTQEFCAKVYFFLYRLLKCLDRLSALIATLKMVLTISAKRW